MHCSFSGLHILYGWTIVFLIPQGTLILGPCACIALWFAFFFRRLPRFFIYFLFFFFINNLFIIFFLRRPTRLLSGPGNKHVCGWWEKQRKFTTQKKCDRGGRVAAESGESETEKRLETAWLKAHESDVSRKSMQDFSVGRWGESTGAGETTASLPVYRPACCAYLLLKATQEMLMFKAITRWVHV